MSLLTQTDPDSPPPADMEDLMEHHRNPNSSSLRFPSTYGYLDGKLESKNFKGVPREARYSSSSNSSRTAGQTLRICYPEIDFQLPSHSAGWSSNQWQAIAIGDLEIKASSTDEETLFSFVLDKAAEFALVSTSTPLDTSTIDWYNGDWYSYNSQYLAVESPAPFPHLISLLPGSYHLLVRAAFEFRIFGDPASSESKTPTVEIGIDVEMANGEGRKDGLARPISARVLDQAPSLLVPDLLDGWLAGSYLRIGVRNEGMDWIEVIEAEIDDPAASGIINEVDLNFCL